MDTNKRQNLLSVNAVLSISNKYAVQSCLGAGLSVCVEQFRGAIEEALYEAELQLRLKTAYQPRYSICECGIAGPHDCSLTDYRGLT